MSVPRTTLFALALLMLACAETQAPAQVTVETEDQKLMYAVGMGLALQFDMAGLFTEEELAYVSKGFSDVVLKRPTDVDVGEEFMKKMNTLVMDRRSAENLTAGSAFLEDAAAKEGAVRTASGLVYIELEAGDGPQPTATDSVTVHYEGRFTDGRVFDSSLKRGKPVTFAMGGVIPGWTEGLLMMKVGGKAKLVIPPQLGYGERGSGSIPPNATLVFEVALLSIQ